MTPYEILTLTIAIMMLDFTAFQAGKKEK